jgi:hypothetical protein
LITCTHSYCAAELGVQPPADWSVDPFVNNSHHTGTIRTISNVLPAAFGEDNEISAYGNTYSNQVLFNANGNKYQAQISLSGPLTSGVNFIPVSSLQYMTTYVYIFYGLGDPNDGPGKGGFNQKYINFSLAPTTVYTSTTFEAASNVQGQFQFKYAVLVPNNQPAGTYRGTINYQIIKDSDHSVINSGTADIQVIVGNLFSLSADRGTADFVTMKPGETKDNVPPEGIIITSKTNDGNPWFLKISDTSPLSAGPYVIPNSNMIWYGWTDGKGTWYGNGTNAFTFVPSLMYASSMTETNNLPDGTNNHLKLKLTIPPGQPGGKYISTIQLTMTE